MPFVCGNFAFQPGRPLIMGVLNVTPDSFSDGGKFIELNQSLSHASRLIDEGADMLDIGGESTRPGAPAVSLEEERRRVLPVISALCGRGVPLSLDTQKPELMSEAVAAGVSLVNDVNGFEATGAFEAVAASRAAICIMHKQGTPDTMQAAPEYADVVGEVDKYLAQRIDAAVHAGISRERIVIDPGFGFGKTLVHNLALLRGLRTFTRHGVALLVGLSRKTMLGQLTGRETSSRLHASVAAALLAVDNGAGIVRVHDVAATRDALRVWEAVRLG